MIKIETHINSSIQKVWEMFTTPEHICNWNFAGDDWHCPATQLDLTVGGSFTMTMAARDASFQFDFSGTYTAFVVNERIDIILEDGRLWNTTFEAVEGGVKVVEEFDPESQNPEDMQRMGWQMILDRFKNYVESKNKEAWQRNFQRVYGRMTLREWRSITRMSLPIFNSFQRIPWRRCLK